MASTLRFVHLTCTVCLTVLILSILYLIILTFMFMRMLVATSIVKLSMIVVTLNLIFFVSGMNNSVSTIGRLCGGLVIFINLVLLRSSIVFLNVLMRYQGLF